MVLSLGEYETKENLYFLHFTLMCIITFKVLRYYWYKYKIYTKVLKTSWNVALKHKFILVQIKIEIHAVFHNSHFPRALSKPLLYEPPFECDMC